jgi:hypothetical protein
MEDWELSSVSLFSMSRLTVSMEALQTEQNSLSTIRKKGTNFLIFRILKTLTTISAFRIKFSNHAKFSMLKFISLPLLQIFQNSDEMK